MYYNRFMNALRDGNWLHIECDEQLTLQQFCERMSLPVRKVNQMIQLKKCLLDQKHCMMSDSLEHKTLSLCLFEEEEIDFACDQKVAEVLYEDDYVLVVNKPSSEALSSTGHTKVYSFLHVSIPSVFLFLKSDELDYHHSESSSGILL